MKTKLINEKIAIEFAEEKYPILNKCISEMSDAEFNRNEKQKVKRTAFVQGVNYADDKISTLLLSAIVYVVQASMNGTESECLRLLNKFLSERTNE